MNLNQQFYRIIEFNLLCGIDGIVSLYIDGPLFNNERLFFPECNWLKNCAILNMKCKWYWQWKSKFKSDFSLAFDENRGFFISIDCSLSHFSILLAIFKQSVVSVVDENLIECLRWLTLLYHHSVWIVSIFGTLNIFI